MIADSETQSPEHLIEEITKLYQFTGNLDQHQGSLCKLRWKANCLLSLKVWRLRKTSEGLWKDHLQTLEKTLNLKDTKMKELLAAGKLFCKFECLLFPLSRIPSYKKLDVFAKNWETHKEVLQREFEWFKLQEEDLCPVSLIRALKQQESSELERIVRFLPALTTSSSHLNGTYGGENTVLGKRNREGTGDLVLQTGRSM